MKNLPNDITKRLFLLFQNYSERQEADKLLTQAFNLDLMVGPGQFVRAVLTLSEGDLNKLKRHLATSDHRDTIMDAERHEGNPGHYFSPPFEDVLEGAIGRKYNRYVASKLAKQLYQKEIEFKQFVTEFPEDEDDDPDVSELFSLVEHESGTGIFGISRGRHRDYIRKVQDLIDRLEHPL